MPKVIDLSQSPWQLSGWTPEAWRMAVSMELGLANSPEIAPLACSIPASVQKVLLDHGLLPDWNADLDSRACEWVENRHWLFEVSLPKLPAGESVRLCLDGVDGACEVWLNKRLAGTITNSFIPHTFELRDLISPLGNRLGIAFVETPRWLGQIGFTSRIRDWKPRFAYTWDWIPRMVQIGISHGMRLEIGASSRLADIAIFTDYDPATGRGTVHFSDPQSDCGPVRWTLSDGGGAICSEGNALAEARNLAVIPWEPNGSGEPRLYTLTLAGNDETRSISIGFKKVEWRSCLGAPPEADPWLCRVNGRDTFLQGVNWTPIRPNFADLTRADYELRLKQYRDLGFNCIRVWGGGFREHDWLYELCDRFGLLVWQDFPLSSSGLDNWPPEEPSVMAEAVRIARDWIRRLQSHAALLMWCGGNELQGAPDGGKIGIGKPVTPDHPLIAQFHDAVRELDPTRRFVASTASGPRFMAAAADFGKGLHWDVHGPWVVAKVDVEPWEDYWKQDDALFRSEMGNPGAQNLDLFEKYVKQCPLLDSRLETPYWQRFGWWFEFPEFHREFPQAAWTIADYVKWSQTRQAEHLSRAIAIVKSRFPRCGGFLIWMGHDCFPCAVNTSLLDFEGRPKPAAFSLAKVLKASTGPLS